MKTVVNLTEQSVIKEIESILDNYPYYPYQQAFAIPDLRQELIAYVLSRIPCFYSAVEPEKAYWSSYKLRRQPLEQQLHLENLIQQGIFSLIQEKSDWVSHHLCEMVKPDCEPSHWFG
ncbi:hypothetical protein WA1_03435 [Scytonema hofmannii PCC 7110]|jgi:hypothetical protein|uniref:Late competence development ComFB family protein n=1 Tax=Scytonema hofmannii PCC 7110 TaxID=128403 RepID=A0A139X902_9CYAN|nr:late competence development ComFB family protein [Scytonema hofmannii]KYC41156.1 hypothetical protein WA1_03435 [Scytonema hofmannii PCC 7110]